MHSELLAKSDNKYDLVLQVARRAKLLKEDIQRDGTVEVMKPIPMAIEEMIEEAHRTDAEA